MEKGFKYDIYTFIEMVESRPCLWDKTIKQYKDKGLKSCAWREICSYFEPDFENFDKRQQYVTETMFADRWKNLKDAFNKSLKSTGQQSRKKYIYYDKMQFLLKILRKDEAISNISSEKISPVSVDETFPSSDSETLELYDMVDVQTEPPTTTMQHVDHDRSSGCTIEIETPRKQDMFPRKRRRILSQSPNIEIEILRQLQLLHEHHLQTPDEDEAFFLSVLPFVRKLKEEKKLDFRMGVLSLIKKLTTTSSSVSSVESNSKT